MRLARRHAERDGQIVVIKVVPKAQLNDLTLTRLHSGQDGVDQTPEFGLSPVTVDVGQVVGRRADHAERHSRVARLADHEELHRRIRQLAGPIAALAHRPELHRRIRRPAGPIAALAHRPELHRRIRRPAGPIARLTHRIGRLVHRIGLFIAGRRRRPESASAFVAGQCEQLRAQPGGLGEVAGRRSGDDECVLQGPGRVRRVVKHPMAVAVQGSRVPVVRHGDARWVSRLDRHDNLAVVLDVFEWQVRRPFGGRMVGQLGRRTCDAVGKPLPSRLGRRPTEADRKHSPRRLGGRSTEADRKHLPDGIV